MVLGSSFQVKVAAAFTAAVAVVTALSVIAWCVAEDAALTANDVAKTNALLYGLARTRANTLQIELTTQGFRLSGDPLHLVERNAAIADRETSLAELGEFVRDHPQQHERWLALREVIAERLAIARLVEELRKTQGEAAANAYVATAPLRSTRERVYQLLGDMIATERARVTEQENAHARARQTLVVIGILAAIALTALLLATFILIRRQLARTEQAQSALIESEESLAVTLHSIGDAMLATDTEERITRMNPVAEHLTGWSFAEAKGRHVNEVFRIVHEHTRQAAEIPVSAVLASGQPKGLANHTAVISRDGRETPIADSAAPIHDRSGKIQGVVLIFRDVTLEHETKRLLHAHNQSLQQDVHERTRQLEEAEHHLQSVIDAVPAMVAFVDTDRRYVYVNEQYRERFALADPDIVGRPVEEILGTALYGIARPLIEKVLAGEPQSYDSQPFPGVWQAIRYQPKCSGDGSIEGYYVLGTDITERKKAEEKIRGLNSELAQRVRELERVSRALRTLSAGNRTMLRASDEQSLLDNMCQAIVTVGGYGLAVVRYRGKDADFKLKTMAECGFPGGIAALDELGFTVDDSALGQGVTAAAIKANEVRRISDLNTDPNHAVWEGRFGGFSSGLACPLRVGNEVIGALSIYDREPNTFGNDEIALLTEFSEDLAFGIATLRSRAEQTRTQAAMDHMVRHDALTGLPNANGFSEAVTAAIGRQDRQQDQDRQQSRQQNQQQWAAMLFNIERLGEINDVLGFSYGDQILRDFGQRLWASLPPTASVARLRGDEFAALIPVTGASEAQALAEQLENRLASPFAVAGIDLAVTSNIGIALYPEHGATTQDLLRGMGKALYQARARGLNRSLYSPDQRQDQIERLNMVGELKRAIEDGELRVYLQPKVELSTSRVCGAEALVRWQHPRKGLLPPGMFIGLAEQTGLIKPLTEWLIIAVLDLLQTWQSQGRYSPIAINLSARNFRDEQLFDKFHRWQAERGLERGLLEIEITESTVMDDAEYALRVLHALRDVGIPLYVDDFGTGYSSLSYLQKLPFDYIKIDQSFVAAMSEKRDSAMIVRSTIDLVHDLGRKTVAEGVETAEHWRLLKKLDCDMAQGYFIAKPMPADEFLSWMAAFQAPH